MLVPVFFMFYKHQRSLARFNRNLAFIQAKRDEQALRIAQLAREAPEKLTRAERAAVEGKMAWRKSVARWQATKKHGEGSVYSNGWSTPDSGEMPSPNRQNGSPSSIVHGRYLEMAVSIQRDLPPSGELRRDVDAAAATESRFFHIGLGNSEQASKQQDEQATGIPLQDLASKDGLGTSAGAVAMSIDLGAKVNPATSIRPVKIPQRPTIVTDGKSQSRGTVATRDATCTSALQKPTSTTSYGFHLPHPQAGQAYTMSTKPELADAEKSSSPDAKGLQQNMARDLRMTCNTVPANPVQLAIHSPSPPIDVSSEISAPIIVPHVPQPLQRRSARIRRASFGRVNSSASRAPTKRTKLARGKWFPSASADDLHELAAAASNGT